LGDLDARRDHPVAFEILEDGPFVDIDGDPGASSSWGTAAVSSVALQTAIAMARRIQALIATTPALQRVAEKGWNQTDPSIIPELEPLRRKE
jgi:hypothetical protein